MLKGGVVILAPSCCPLSSMSHHHSWSHHHPWDQGSLDMPLPSELQPDIPGRGFPPAACCHHRVVSEGTHCKPQAPMTPCTWRKQLTSPRRFCPQETLHRMTVLHTPMDLCHSTILIFLKCLLEDHSDSCTVGQLTSNHVAPWSIEASAAHCSAAGVRP